MRTVKSVPIARARTCYDHLAGQLGVALFAALVARGAVKAQKNAPGDVELGSQAESIFRKLGIELEIVRRERRRFATACLDWTERRPHLGGALGAALWSEVTARGWIARRPGTRAVAVTRSGARGLKRALGIALD